MRRVPVLLAVAIAAAAVVAALRRRPEADAPYAAPAPRPAREPVRPVVDEPPGTADDAPATRFVELAEDEQSRRHEAAERLKADLHGR
jgi:hypothetical protein